MQKPGDVAAAHMELKAKEETLKITIATNAGQASAKQQAHRLNLLYNRLKATDLEPESAAFQHKLMQILLDYCMQKLKKVVQQIRDKKLIKIQTVVAEAREGRIVSDESAMATALEEERKKAANRTADKVLRKYAAAWNCSLPAAIQHLFTTIVELIPRAFNDSEHFYGVSSFAHTLSTSVISRSYISTCYGKGCEDSEIMKLLDAMSKLGKYARGADRLKRNLTHHCQPRLPELDIEVLPTREDFLPTHPSPKDALKYMYQQQEGAEPDSEEMDVYEAFVSREMKVQRRNPDGSEGQAFKSTLKREWAKPLPSKLHAEMNLILNLRQRGLKKGTIGISKLSCAACYGSKMAINRQPRSGGREAWEIFGAHGNVYLSIPTNIPYVDKAVLQKFEQVLRNQVEAFLMTRGRPESVHAPSSSASFDDLDDRAEEAQKAMSINTGGKLDQAKVRADSSNKMVNLVYKLSHGSH